MMAVEPRPLPEPLRQMLAKALPVGGSPVMVELKPDVKPDLDEFGNRPPMVHLNPPGPNRHVRRMLGAKLRRRAKLQRRHGPLPVTPGAKPEDE